MRGGRGGEVGRSFRVLTERCRRTIVGGVHRAEET